MYCVNDMAVMQAWFDDMMIKPSSILTPLADPTRSFTKALDLEMEGTPPQLGYVRSKRFAAVFDDGKCTNLFVSAAPGDPVRGRARTRHRRAGCRACEYLTRRPHRPATTTRRRRSSRTCSRASRRLAVSNPGDPIDLALRL